MSPEGTSRVFLIASSDRSAAVRALWERAAPGDLNDKSIALKANFNSADPFPASTHTDTVRAIVTLLKDAGAGDVTLAERSGMGDTRTNLEKLGIFALAEQVGFKVVVLDEEPAERWEHVKRSGNHWSRGFHLAKVVLEADVVIQTCCLKTHQYGGHHTMSLKNSVGLVARAMPGDDHDYMHELHGSPFQRLMVAEINAAYPVDFVIMDAAQAFIDGGPDKGTQVAPGLMLASTDRVALDAAGVALLREFGCTTLGSKPIFELDQLRRAAELGVGVGSAAGVELVPLDDESRKAAASIRTALDFQPR
jgi:uncharacterized protein (DUF362 family)